MPHEFKVEIVWKPGVDLTAPSPDEIALIYSVLPELMDIVEELEKQEEIDGSND